MTVVEEVKDTIMTPTNEVEHAALCFILQTFRSTPFKDTTDV